MFQVLSVAQLLHGTPAASLVCEGDLLLAIDGKLVCTFRDVEVGKWHPCFIAKVWWVLMLLAPLFMLLPLGGV